MVVQITVYIMQDIMMQFCNVEGSFSSIWNIN
jgi:hypothetical protein